MRSDLGLLRDLKQMVKAKSWLEDIVHEIETQIKEPGWNLRVRFSVLKLDFLLAWLTNQRHPEIKHLRAFSAISTSFNFDRRILEVLPRRKQVLELKATKSSCWTGYKNNTRGLQKSHCAERALPLKGFVLAVLMPFSFSPYLMKLFEQFKLSYFLSGNFIINASYNAAFKDSSQSCLPQDLAR